MSFIAASRRPDPTPSATEPLPGTAKRVLVVDDNQDAAEMLAVLLTAWGLQTRVAYDGPSALTIAQDFEPAVALLDIGLPGLDGYDTARRMRQQPWGRTALLVAVTGWGQAADLARSREAGFDHHLVKPVNLDGLRTLITSAPTRPNS
jgi:CheY-like chemotaxis protein